MDFSLSFDQLLIRDTVREFMRTEVRPHVKDWERTDHFPLDAIHKLGALGCCGMLMPEEWGGPGLDTISYVLMLEEVARVHAAMATALSVTNSAVQLPLLAHATNEQKSRYLKRLASGEILGAFCLTEPAAGSDAAAIQCTAVRGTVTPDGALGVSASPARPDPRGAALSSCSGRTLDRPSESASAPFFLPAPTQNCHPERALSAREGSAFSPASHQPPPPTHYLLSGTKTWVTNGSAAGLYLVFAKTDPSAGGKGITAFLLEPNTPGLKIGRHEDKMGQRSSPSVEIILDNCEIPAANRLGEEGNGLKIALSALDAGRIGIAAVSVGLAQGALDESVKYAKSRRAFGKSIGEFQAIQWMLADMHTELEAARALLYHAALLKDRTRPGHHPVAQGESASPAAFPSSGRTLDRPSESPSAPSFPPNALPAPTQNCHSERAPSAREGSAFPAASHQPLATSHSSSSASRAKLYASEMANRVVYKAVQIHGSLGYSRESDVERMYRDARVLTIYEGTSEIQRTIIARDLLAKP